MNPQRDGLAKELKKFFILNNALGPRYVKAHRTIPIDPIRFESAFSLQLVGMRKRFVFFDDEITKVVASGCEQVVTLAVGFDCRCLRLPCLQAPNVTHFIVDQPDMIRHLLSKCPEIHDREGKGKIIPVTCKFGEQTWWDEIKAKGFDPNKRTVFITEGLTMYLEESEVQELYEQIYKLSVPGCWVLGD